MYVMVFFYVIYFITIPLQTNFNSLDIILGALKHIILILSPHNRFHIILWKKDNKSYPLSEFIALALLSDEYT